MESFIHRNLLMCIFVILMMVMCVVVFKYSDRDVGSIESIKQLYDALIVEDFDVAYIAGSNIALYDQLEVGDGLIEHILIKSIRVYDGKTIDGYIQCKKYETGLYFINSITTSGYCTGVYVNKRDVQSDLGSCIKPIDEESCWFGGYII